MLRDAPPPRPACSQGSELRKLISRLERDGRKSSRKAEEGRALIEAGKAHCIATCGGCELTREPEKPRKACRERVGSEIAALEREITGLGSSGVLVALDRARRARRASCVLCGRCSLSRRPLTPLADLRR